MQKRTSFLLYFFLAIMAVFTGGSVGFIIYSISDLPEVKALEEYKPSATSRVYSDNNKLLAEFFMENRTPVALGEVPQNLINALIATEDQRFYNHRGIDLHGIVRAVFKNFRSKKVVEGGSTLTQQLAKVLFLTPERSYTRKLKELALALRIEQRYTKREILQLYLNQIYFGNGAYGIESAAEIYFGKTARELNLAECAMVAGLPRSPTHYSPFKSRERALSRRAYVLNRMASMNVITQNAAEEAKKAALPDRANMGIRGRAPYFVEFIRQKVEEQFGPSILYSGGLNIYTTINDELQDYAEEAVRSGLAKIEGRHAKKKVAPVPLQAALLAIDPVTGQIKAMVGGSDYAKSQFNRTWQALRQPGSAFKPLIYAAALELGYSPADIFEDAPLTIKLDKKNSWSPENFSRTYQGPVTLRKALAQSLNVPTIKLLEKVSIEEAINFSRTVGINSQLQPYLSLALGSSDVTLLELTSAYSVFADRGMKLGPLGILTITDSNGQILYANDAVPEQVIKPETAFLITNLLRGVVERGTGWKARELGRPVAGKTGTTNDYCDGWFLGYAPSLVAGVWVGFDDHRSIGEKETGAQSALPIWIDFMKKALADREPEEFSVPAGIIFEDIDPKTGLLASEHCKQRFHEAFLAGSAPRKYCDEHAQSVAENPVHDEAPGLPQDN